MSGVITYEMVGVVGGALTAAAIFVSWILSRFALRDKKIQDLQKELLKEIGTLQKALHEHKLYAAEHYATKDGLTDALRSMESAIDRLTERLDNGLAVLLRQAASKKDA